MRSRKRDCFAAAAMGPTEASQPIMSPMFPIVASILDIKRATQISRVGGEQRERETTWAFVRRVVEETNLR